MVLRDRPATALTGGRTTGKEYEEALGELVMLCS